MIQSGFEEILKKNWLGENYNLKTKEANGIFIMEKSNFFKTSQKQIFR